MKAENSSDSNPPTQKNGSNQTNSNEPTNLDEAKDKNIVLPKSLKFGAFVDTYYSHNGNHPNSKERLYSTQAVRNEDFFISYYHTTVR